MQRKYLDTRSDGSVAVLIFATSCSKGWPFCSAHLYSFAGSSSKLLLLAKWLLKEIYSISFSCNDYNKSSFCINCMSFNVKLNTPIGLHFITVMCYGLQTRFSTIWASISTFPRPAMRHKRYFYVVCFCICVGSVKTQIDRKWCSGAWRKLALESIPIKSTSA